MPKSPERDPDFVAEALGYLSALETEASGWAVRCTPASIQTAFRNVHTLKGAAGFVGEDELESLAHAIEEVIAGIGESAQEFADRRALVRLGGLVASVRHELSGLGNGPDSGSRELAGDAFVTLLQQGRRLAAAHGRHVQVCLSGADVRLPSHVVETLRGPLAHLIRNSVAHGVEPPQVRASHGKPYFATLEVEFEDEPAEFRVTVRDDGGGFDLDALRSRIVARCIATPAAAREMNTAELVRAAFLPGVSTAPEVSSLAGRGMGLEAARASIEAAGGVLELATEQHRGTVLTIHLPKQRTDEATTRCRAS